MLFLLLSNLVEVFSASSRTEEFLVVRMQPSRYFKCFFTCLTKVRKSKAEYSKFDCRVTKQNGRDDQHVS